METIRYTPGNETILEIDNGHLKVEFADIGEGFNGDYNPDDPCDMSLVRFYLYEKVEEDSDIDENAMVDEDGWLYVDDSSRCTSIDVDTPQNELESLARFTLSEFDDALTSGASIKHLADRLSWLGADPELDGSDIAR